MTDYILIQLPIRFWIRSCRGEKQSPVFRDQGLSRIRASEDGYEETGRCLHNAWNGLR